MAFPARADAGPPGPALPGFEHVSRFDDRKAGGWVARILPGEFYVSRDAEIISTVLGSCVSACIRDPVARVAGMNHFMLPDTRETPKWGGGLSAATRYGSYAMERLVNELMRYGGRRERFEVKLFGGARMFESNADIGRQNIDFVMAYLATERIPVVAEDLGGEFGRKVLYATDTGRVRVRRLGEDSVTVAREERVYRSTLRASTATRGGDVELFD